MQKHLSWGLLTAGPASRLEAIRLPFLLDQLGPVKATTFREASLAVRAIRAGEAARDYQALGTCRYLLLYLPSSHIPSAVAELREAPIQWADKTVLLWSAEEDSLALQPLQAAGASVGSLFLVPGQEDRRCIVEGDTAAIRLSKRLLGHRPLRFWQIEPGSKTLLRAGTSLAGPLSLSLMLSSLMALQQAGLAYPEAIELIENTVQRQLRSFKLAGKRSWHRRHIPNPLAEQASLARHSPLVAAHYHHCLQVTEKLAQR